MNDQHKMELLKALREHGQTIKKFASGGLLPTGAPAAAAPTTTLAGPSQSGSGTASQTTGALGGLDAALGTQSNFNASGANIQAGTNAGQLNTAYNTAQGGLTSQQNFLNALQAQNGVQNQSNVFNQEQGIANGTGPNPAQTMLNQETGQNVSNQAALMAGQRGASANVGLMARQNAQNGAQIQQNAIGQGASLEAQQQLNALGAMGATAQNQVGNLGAATQGINQAAQGEQSILQNANSATNQANVGMQSNMNTVNAGISEANQGAGNGLLGGVLNGASSAISNIFAEGGEVQNFDEGGGVQPTSAPPAPVGVTAMPMPQPRFNIQPQNVAAPAPGMGAAPAAGPKSNVGQFLGGSAGAANGSTAPSGGTGGGQFLQQGLSSLFSALGKNSTPSATNMSNEDAEQAYLDADVALDTGNTQEMPAAQDSNPDVQAAARGGIMGGKLKGGGKVPGKPKVGGAVNTEKNDNVPALLSAGEIVLPRSVTQSKDPVNNAARFVAALMAKKGQAPRKAKAA
jgi:hypothetical protein